jgi:hypothetical protein
MASEMTPQGSHLVYWGIILGYWLFILFFAAFSLRMACSLCQVGMPSWFRAVISVIVVTLLAYLTFDFTCYLIMRSMDGVLLVVPPGYTYGLWFREPLALKWYIVSHAGFLKYLPFIFGVCVAGVLQVVVLQVEVTFRWGLVIFFLQWAATLLAGYIVSLLLGSVLSSVGWSIAQQRMAQGPAPAEGKAENRKPPPPPRGTKARRTKGGSKGKTPAESEQAPAENASESSTLQMVQQQAESAAKESKEFLVNAGSNLKEFGDSQLEELKEITSPVTRHLPERVQTFLNEKDGWWWILGALALLSLLWLRAMVRKLIGGGAGSRKRKGKKKRTKSVRVNLREDLALVGEGFTDPGPQRIVVKGMPARLRLVVLANGTAGRGALSEEMADRVLDWIKHGLAEVASSDSPGVRVWPPFYSAEGFATSLQSNIVIPEPKGTKSHWVVLAGDVRLGRSVLRVGLVLHGEEPNSLRYIKVSRERWADALAIEETPASAMAW